MPYLSTSLITMARNGVIATEPTNGESLIFADSQLLPAADGTWLMVDWFQSDGRWYVTEQEA